MRTHFVPGIEVALLSQEDWQIQPIDLLTVLQPALQIFEHLDIFSYIGGSVASSLHGMQQAAQDIDLVIDLPDLAPVELLPLLQAHYVLNVADVAEALQQRRSFACLHPDMLQRLDVIVPHTNLFDITMRRQVASHFLDEHYPPIRVASVVEMIIWKLHRYQQHALASHNGMFDDAT